MLLVDALVIVLVPIGFCIVVVVYVVVVILIIAVVHILFCYCQQRPTWGLLESTSSEDGVGGWCGMGSVG